MFVIVKIKLDKAKRISQPIIMLNRPELSPNVDAPGRMVVTSKMDSKAQLIH